MRRWKMKSLDSDASQQAAVHQVVATGAEGRPIRREKRSEFRNLFRRPNSAKGMSFSESFEDLFDRSPRRKVPRGTFEHRSSYGPGAD